MNENRAPSKTSPRSGRRNDVEFLETFYNSPNMELCMARFRTCGDLTVAKRLPIAYRHDRAQREVFQNECEYLQALSHPGIARPEPTLEIAGEIVQLLLPDNYVTISQLTDMCRRLEQSLPLDLGLLILGQILLAMVYLREKAPQTEATARDMVLHPDALLVNSKGQVLVTRVGLSNPPYITSSILDAESKRYFAYAAPEQCVAGRVPDGRVCFYTLGMLCYELLTGQPLFSSATIKKLDTVTRRKLRRLHPLASDVDRDLAPIDDLIMALLDPLPEKRETQLDKIVDGFGCLCHLVKRCGPNDLAAYRARLEDLLRSGEDLKDESDVVSQLSAVTDIAEYNAS